MGWYSQVIFPRLCDWFLDQPHVSEQRRRRLAETSGEILEIGFGTGLNLPHYPAGVRRIVTVDSNRGMRRRAQRRIDQSPIAVEQHLTNGEQLPFREHTFDCVVSTFTLCSIADVNQALREVLRVLRPGGRFLFLEHGLSPEPGVQRWQRRWNWLQSRLGDGCRLDRDIQKLVGAQPFSAVETSTFYLERTPKTHGHIYSGAATR